MMFRLKYVSLSMHLRGEKLRKEVIALLDGLPKTYAEIAEDSKELEAAKRAYTGFLELTLDGQDKNVEVLPTLGFLMAKGNVTTYEWVHGEAPLTVEEPAIDFGGDDDDAGAGAVGDGAGIDFGDDDAGGIDFGDDDAGGIDFGDDDDVGGGGEIDWGNLDSGDAQVGVV